MFAVSHTIAICCVDSFWVAAYDPNVYLYEGGQLVEHAALLLAERTLQVLHSAARVKSNKGERGIY